MRQYGTSGGRDGHSVLAALEEAHAAARDRAVEVLLEVPLGPLGIVKVFGLDATGEVRYSTEVPRADLPAIRAAFGPVRTSPLAQRLRDDGMDAEDAAETVARLRGLPG